MKILDRKQFMALPPGAICCEGGPWAFGPWFVKLENCGEDFLKQDLGWDQFEGNISTDTMLALADKALEGGTSLKMDFDSVGRDGCFEFENHYCVLEDSDIDALVNRLLGGKGKAP